MSNKNLLCISLVLILKYVVGNDITSLTFVIDDTSSMLDDIISVRQSVGDIFDMVTANRETSQIDNFILVAFNDRSEDRYDPDVRVLAKTKQRDVFMRSLNSITATTGGAYTCEEYALAGINRALMESKPKSTIYVFSDATAKDFNQYEQIKRMAQQKQCPIVFVLTGMCREPPTSPRYKVFQDLAAATGGQVFHMDKGEMGKVLEYVRETVTGTRATLANKNLPPGKNTFTFDTDPKMNDVLLSMTSTGANNPTVKINSPDGTETPKTLVTSSSAAQVYKVNTTMPGQHTVEVNSPEKPTRAVVSAKTEVTFDHGFSTYIPMSLLETSIRPTPGENYLSIRLTKGDVDLKTVRILDMNQNLIQELPLIQTNNEEKLFTTQPFQTPGSTFQLAITGFDPKTQTTIVRQATTPVEVQKTLPGDVVVNKAVSIVIEGGEKVNVKQGATVQLVCKVEGYPRPTIVWKSQNGNVMSDKVLPGKNVPYDYVNVFTITKAEESATYSCEATNTVNSASKTVSVEVTRVSYLRITDKSQSVIANCDAESKMECTVEAEPRSNIIWYRNGNRITPDAHMVLTASSTTPGIIKYALVIKNPSPADNGRYTCEASNGGKKQTLDHLFAALECNDGVRIDKQMTTVTASSGENVTFRCKILQGTPKPSIHWIVETQEKYIFSMDDWRDQEFPVLRNVKPADTGKYVCRAKNSNGRDMHAIQLLVK